MTSTRRLTLLSLGLLGLVFVFAGCDSDSLDDRDTGGNGGVLVENDVRVFTFTLNDQDRGEFRFGRTFSTDSSEVQYDTDEDFYPQLTALLTDRTVNEGVVLLYVSDVLNDNGLRRSGWTALPLSIGFDEDSDLFVDYVLTTTYTYDVNRLFVNLVASDTATIAFLQDTQALLSNLEDIRFRLVAIPGGGFNRGIDYSDYEAVARAYNLPD